MRVADIQTLYDYNYWATDRILRTAANLTTEQFTMATRFPHGSLRATLVHMLWAEGVWLNFWQEKPRYPFLTEDEFADLATLCAQWREQEAEVRAYLTALADEILDRPLTHNVPRRGFDYTAPLWVFIIHPVNHGTLHRGEAAQILTEFGHSPGDFDLMFFLNERGV